MNQYLLDYLIILLVFFLVVAPAVWSKDPLRRADARKVLRIILDAFGR